MTQRKIFLLISITSDDFCLFLQDFDCVCGFKDAS